MAQHQRPARPLAPAGLHVVAGLGLGQRLHAGAELAQLASQIGAQPVQRGLVVGGRLQLDDAAELVRHPVLVAAQKGQDLPVGFVFHSLCLLPIFPNLFAGGLCRWGSGQGESGLGRETTRRWSLGPSPSSNEE